MAKKQSGVTRSIVLSEERDARLNALCEETGHNRNYLVNLFAAKASPEDVKALQSR